MQSFFMVTMRTMIKLCRYASWSVSLLSAHVRRDVFSICSTNDPIESLEKLLQSSTSLLQLRQKSKGAKCGNRAPYGIWCVMIMCEKGLYATGKQWSPRSAYTSVQSDPSIFCLTYMYVSRQRRPWSGKFAGWSGPALSANCIRALLVCCTSYANSAGPDQVALLCSLIRFVSVCWYIIQFYSIHIVCK